MTLDPRHAPLLETAGVRHGFFTRQGGVSKGIYQSLNCGPGSNDDKQAVQENRARVVQHLGGTGKLNTLYQIHSGNVIVLDRALPPGNVTKGDGLVTKTPGLVIAVLTADCAPVLFSDPAAGVIAAAHAGWHGALGGILGNVVGEMVKLGAAKENIRAAVGPAIGPESYEVGDEFLDAFKAKGLRFERFFKPAGKDKHLFALEDFCLDRLRAAGLTQIEGLSLDTYAFDKAFFSYRRTCHRNEPDYGRQAAAIVLE